MKKPISLWQFAGFAFVAVVGVLLHFLYDLTNQNILFAPFSAVNESTFEHLKLLFFPMFAFAVIQSFFFKDFKNFRCVKLIGISVGLILIPVLFYTVNGVFGTSPDWLNIAIFFISAAVSFIVETRLFKNPSKVCKPSLLCFIIICIIAVLFVLFTFFTPHIPFFEDPLSRTYGI